MASPYSKHFYAYGEKITEEIYINDPVDYGNPLMVKAVDVPVARESDPFIFHFIATCYSSCLNSMGDAKNQLKVRFYILTSHNEVLARHEQPIRIVANPGRDAREYTKRLSAPKAVVRPLELTTRAETQTPMTTTTTKPVKYRIKHNGTKLIIYI